MGAWGEGPLDSDQALDWMWRPADMCADEIRKLCMMAKGQEDRYGHELRAAAWLFSQLSFHMGRSTDELGPILIERLRALLDGDHGWVDDWREPDVVRHNIEAEIAKIK